MMYMSSVLSLLLFVFNICKHLSTTVSSQNWEVKIGEYIDFCI